MSRASGSPEDIIWGPASGDLGVCVGSLEGVSWKLLSHVRCEVQD